MPSKEMTSIDRGYQASKQQQQQQQQQQTKQQQQKHDLN